MYTYCYDVPAWHYRETFILSCLTIFYCHSQWGSVALCCCFSISLNRHWTTYTFCVPTAFFEQDKDLSYKEKENLLKQTAALEEYMQQGIPVVSRFLAEYLPRWDGEDFREMVFHLLQWVTFSSYLGKSNSNS